jgi:hypothetical protein
MEMKGERAQSITNQLLSTDDTENWPIIVQSHLLDYVNFYADWWKEFIADNKRANFKITKPELVEFNKLYSWIKNQVSPTLSVIFDILPFEAFLELIEYGRQRRGHKFDLILEKSKNINKEYFNDHNIDSAIQPKTIDEILPSNKLSGNVVTKKQNVELPVHDYRCKLNPIFQKLEIHDGDFERHLGESSGKEIRAKMVMDKFQSSRNEKPNNEEFDIQGRNISIDKEETQQIT